ncbi:MAG: M28 family peptidase [Gemmatimonadales bacterium]
MPRAPLVSGLAVALSPLALALACSGGSPPIGAAAPMSTGPGISAADLKARLLILADDSMQGRRAGTEGNVKGTDYIAAEAGRIGLTPAGEDGGWFQTVPMVEREISKESTLRVDDAVFSPSTDFALRDQGKGTRPLDGVQAVYGGVLGDSSQSVITPDEASGKLVVITMAPAPGGQPVGTVNRALTTAQFSTAAGIAVATLDAIGAAEQAELRQGSAQLAAAPSKPTPSFMYVTSRFATALLGRSAAQAKAGDPGKTVRGVATYTERPAPYPARNVVAILPGSDPALKGEFVAIGAHNDHIGIAPVAQDHDSIRAFNRVMRKEGANSTPGVPTAEQEAQIRTILDSLRKIGPARMDSIFNGADDDGSGSVAVLDIAEALARGPDHPKRSVLFVWHTGEELGLLGSDWFTRHPTVPRDSIVAQLNIDMIGRGSVTDFPGGGPGYLQMIGSRRLSTELGDLVERMNTDGKFGFDFDYQFDADGEPNNYYCRSDHYMYARFGIPIAFFTTGAHLDYHQLTDEPQYIDFAKMARVASLVKATAVAVADLDHRVVVDKAKPDPEGVCKQ